jgi:hypothetical protein
MMASSTDSFLYSFWRMAVEEEQVRAAIFSPHERGEQHPECIRRPEAGTRAVAA